MLETLLCLISEKLLFCASIGSVLFVRYKLRLWADFDLERLSGIFKRYVRQESVSLYPFTTAGRNEHGG